MVPRRRQAKRIGAGEVPAPILLLSRGYDPKKASTLFINAVLSLAVP
jgi:hypothetical protein